MAKKSNVQLLEEIRLGKKRSFTTLKNRALKNDVKAQAYMAYCYEFAIGTEKCPELELEWLKKAAETSTIKSGCHYALKLKLKTEYYNKPTE